MAHGGPNVGGAWGPPCGRTPEPSTLDWATARPRHGDGPGPRGSGAGKRSANFARPQRYPLSALAKNGG